MHVFKQDSRNTKSIAWTLLLIWVVQIVTPTVVFAGGGGPTQPEVQGFTPVGVSDMVDPFTGDFTYNIPLMNIDGYPVNIAYNSGVSMDQEASWVGLGWNLNMGAIVRSMRGLPDDFNGDEVTTVVNMKPTNNIGVNIDSKLEVFGKNTTTATNILGFDSLTKGLKVGMGVDYSNYTGYGVSLSISPSFSLSKLNGTTGTLGLSLSGSSENGPSFSANASFSKQITDKDKRNHSLGGYLGSSYNSRAGLQQISYGATLSHSAKTKNNKRISFSSDFGGAFDLGVAHFSPTVQPNMKSFSLVGSFKFSGTVFSNDIQVGGQLSYSRQWVSDTITSNPAYGYVYHHHHELNKKALLDFNRDNDGSFTKYTPYLPSTQMTYDIFSVQAQGLGGSFRAMRNDITYVYDPQQRSTSTSGNFGFEIGTGNLFEFGADLHINHTTSKSGLWSKNVEVLDNLSVLKSEVGYLLKPTSFVEANEKAVDIDNNMQTSFQGSNATFFELDKIGVGKAKVINKLVANNETNITTNKRASRLITNNQLSILTVDEVENNLGLQNLSNDFYQYRKPHHIGEITQTGTDGRRYVFGIPAYNYYQSDYSFSVGKKMDGSVPDISYNRSNGLVNINQSDFSQYVSTNNEWGIDNYFSKRTTPAYAHSFLLTAVLSDDYIDNDQITGPSDDDLGNYVAFDYEHVENHKWRTPIQEDNYYYDESLKTDSHDDKASVIYGEKELWYVKKVETKNYVAIFSFSKRADGHPVKGVRGGLDASDNNAMLALKKIQLFTKPDFKKNGMNGTPVQIVSFDYSYKLCPMYAGNINALSNNSPADSTGKLTLKSIKVTYQKSNKMKSRKYTFDYNGLNPVYEMKAVDRWGVYRPLSGNTTDAPLHPEMMNADFPYAGQLSHSLADQYASAWHLTDIHLPTGGKIHVDYESDDYAYVQNKRASKMFKIAGLMEYDANGNPHLSDANFAVNQQPKVATISTKNGHEKNRNRELLFQLEDNSDDISNYVKVGQQIYFRTLVDFKPLDAADYGRFEYVSGYAEVSSLGHEWRNGVKYGKILLVGDEIVNHGDSNYSPITKAALLFGRLHLSRNIYDVNTTAAEDADESSFRDFTDAILNSIVSFKDIFSGPNLPIYQKEKGVNIILEKSWIRLIDPKLKKLGGGVRVKQITIHDNWNVLTDNTESGYYYGQEFKYEMPDGTSSGVATYEPQMGGDENTWHQAVVYAEKKRLGIDDKLYQETPVMESQFPSPTVGYARVEIRDISRNGVNRTATGVVVKEFFTAREFPTLVEVRSRNPIASNITVPLLPKHQLLTASQGFSIQLNDMHGKPKKEAVYPQTSSDPISEVNYYYAADSIGMVDSYPFYKLRNNVAVITEDGSLKNENIGVRYDAVADFRESETKSIGIKTDLNFNAFNFGIFLAIPIVLNFFESNTNRFRSATMNKTTQKFGVLEKTVAKQDGSVVATKNIAYDAQTGEVLVTQTTTDFNDEIYQLNYPAYWKYKQLGSLSENLRYTYQCNANNTAGFVAVPIAMNHFIPGDEVKVVHGNTITKAWINDVTSLGIYLIDKQGTPIQMNNGDYIEIIRSGNKNKQATSMASMTTKQNPITGLKNNQFTEVINAGAVEFSDDWNTYCGCFTSNNQSSNPYITGTKGNWRPIRSYTYLADRTQSYYDRNTNIRRDGVFTAYAPFYKNNGSSWNKNTQNWTFVSEVTAFSPNGMTLETRDALGRYATSAFGFNNTLTTAVAANTALKQLAVGNFEDFEYSNCSDQTFFHSTMVNNQLQKLPINALVTTDAHTGKNSLKVTPGSPIVFESLHTNCNDNPCALSMTKPTDGNVLLLNGVNGAVDFDFALINGEATAELLSNGTIKISRIVGGDNGAFKMVFTLKTGNDCEVNYEFNHPSAGQIALNTSTLLKIN